MTAIRIDRVTRDRLAALAAAHGRTVGAEIEALLDDVSWRGIEAAYARLLDGDEPERYCVEAETWAGAELDELVSSASHEYPEYNGIDR